MRLTLEASKKGFKQYITLKRIALAIILTAAIFVAYASTGARLVAFKCEIAIEDDCKTMAECVSVDDKVYCSWVDEAGVIQENWFNGSVDSSKDIEKVICPDGPLNPPFMRK